MKKIEEEKKLKQDWQYVGSYEKAAHFLSLIKKK